MKWNGKMFYACGSGLLLAGATCMAQLAGDNAGTGTALITNLPDGLIYAPTYDECMQSGKPVVTRADIYHDGWIDLNKNGKKDIYEDPTQPVEKRIDDLLSQMTLEEKTAQLATLYGYQRVLKDYLPTNLVLTAERLLAKTYRSISI